jgi:biopolymer transport protein ExbD
MRTRRLKKHPAELEVTAFINLIVVLVPFLLSTAVFSRLAVVDLNLPAQSSGVEQLDEKKPLKLEVVIRQDAIEVADRIGGLIERIPTTPKGHNTGALNVLMMQIKAKFPDTSEATVLAEPSTTYDALVHVMDAVRSTNTAQGAKIVRAELFPQISVGDAPLVRAGVNGNGKGS